MKTFKHLRRHIIHMVRDGQQTHAMTMAKEDARAIAECTGRYFSRGSRPVIRWFKKDESGDAITRAAIGQATRLFGSSVDYCICTNGIDASRVRFILEWANQPVEWWPVSQQDYPQLARLFSDTGSPPERYGHWWKWFPERVRPNAPEWILDGYMVITHKPSWFTQWIKGFDSLRVSQDDHWTAETIRNNCTTDVDLKLKRFSGMISLPPGFHYMGRILKMLDNQPWVVEHDGCIDICEQDVIHATFQKLGAKPIPLYEFPYGNALENHINFGLQGDQDLAWGYQFGFAGRSVNPHFERLTAEKIIFSKPDTGLLDRFHWLQNAGQWGIPGWSMPDGCAKIIAERAEAFAGRPTLELGTSRGRMTAILTTLGCQVTTVDHLDRGAKQNLMGLPARIIQDDAVNFLSQTSEMFDLIVVDFHGNSEADWHRYAKPLLRRLNRKGTLLLNNATLYENPKWRDETGVRWFIGQLSPGWKVDLRTEKWPGVAIVTNTMK